MSAAAYDRVVRTVCSPNCMSSCGVNAFVKDDRIVKLEPGYYPDPAFQRICARGIAMATQRIHHPDRLTRPLLRDGPRGSGAWRAVSWDEAYDHIIAKLSAVAANHGWRANAWMKGSGNYGQRMNLSVARTVNSLGGTMFSNLALSGDGAAPVAYQSTLGELFKSNDVSEIANANYIICAGKSLADTGHSEMHRVFDAIERGAKLVMVDPRYSRSTAKADEWVAPRPGTDAALVMGMLHVIISEGLHKEDYLRTYSNAPFLVRRDNDRLLRERDILPGGGDSGLVWDETTAVVMRPELAQSPALRGERRIAGLDGAMIDCRTGLDASWDIWRKFTPEYASSVCGVPAGQIRHVARDYAKADPAWIWLGFGNQRYHNGHLPARAWITLAAFCGNIGKPYARININESPGLLMMANTPLDYVMPGGRTGHSLPATSLIDILANGAPYPVKSLWMVATGFGTQTPFLDRFVTEALPSLDLFVVSEQLMSPAAQYADVVLPCVSYYEDDWDLVASGELWFMQLRRQAVPPVGESRTDHDIFKGLCERLGVGADWQESPEDICRRLVKENRSPLIAAVDWDVLCRDGVAEIPIEQPHTPFRDMKFKTPSGRIEIYQEQFIEDGEQVLVHKEPRESPLDVRARDFPLTLISYKHPHTTHGQHMMLPYIREMVPEPRIELSPQDAADRDVADGETVRVFNDRGSFTVKALITPGLQAGTIAIMQGWWPRDFAGGHPSFLGHIPGNKVQEKVKATGGETNYPIWDVLCNVVKAEATQ